MAGSFLHLELDNLGIKAMIVEQNYKQTFIKGDCHILFEDLPDSEENIDPFDAGMDRVAQQLDLEICSTAVIFVSPLLVCFRSLELPFDSEKKVKQVLPFELETLLPAVNGTYISDFHMLDTSGESNLILSASIVESQVEKYFSKLGSFGIKPLIIAPGGYAAAVEFLKEHKDISTFIFLDIRDSANTLVMVNNRKPCAVRTFLPSLSSPEELAISVQQTIIGFNQRTGTDISFDIFISSDKDTPNIESIYNVLEKTLEYQPRLRSVEQGLQKALTKENINSNALLLSISPDKTVKYQFNFCKGKYGTSSFLKTYFSNIAAGVALLLCGLALLMLTTSFDNSKLGKKIAAIDNNARSIFMATFPDKKKIQDPYLQMKANARAAIKKSGAAGDKDQFIKNKNVKIVDIISELSKRIASSIDVEISRFLFNNGRLVLSGSTDNFNNVDNIKSKIESSDLFEKVSISSAAADKRGDRVNFKFIIEM
ncbi:MAG: PilN domain-containing protein [Desulfobacula sp.]|uniref:hypothetical protein n=1 Tax=Desulfobacula sp. TaxID=2593537 RepID=UPI0025BDFA83|nr:hypothetical protein [Desulfobacula sp.]MCD4718471.1 PilN domain-containing protein [Desulfobacula sp.]